MYFIYDLDLEGKSHFEKVEMYGILSGLLDGGAFKEFKAFYGPGLIVGTGYIEGYKKLKLWT